MEDYDEEEAPRPRRLPKKKKVASDIRDCILFQDEHHLVLDKPAGLGCLEDRRDDGLPNIHALLREHFPESSLAHRLDVETSGILLVALHPEALRSLSMQFQHREIKKEYVTFISQNVGFTDMTLNRPVGPVIKSGSTTIRRNGEEAITRFVVERSFKGFTKLLCYPKTGRTHQIRIHLSDIGLPIVGDHKYGGTVPYLSKIKKNYNVSRKLKEEHEEPAETPLIQRVALHARRITYVPHGAKDEVTREAPEPRDFVKFTEKLEKFA